MNSKLRSYVIGLALAGLVWLASAAGAESQGNPDALAVIEGFPREAEIYAGRPGFCLDLGCGDGKLAAEIAQKTKYTVFAVAKDDKDCDGARQTLDKAGLYGARATVVVGALKSLPFSKGYGNLIVSGEGLDSFDIKEVLRVLNPNGVAVIGGAKADAGKLQAALDAAGVKDYKIAGHYAVFHGKMAPGMDDWTHNNHGPDNIRTSKDAEVRPPFRTQWLWNTTAHEQVWVCNLVIAAGRMVYRTNGSNHYYAWDSQNGTLLWERQAKAGNFMSPQAFVDGVYYTLEGDKAFALDAATGRELRTFPSPDSSGWLWIAVEKGTLYGLTRGSLKFRGPIGEWFYALNPKDGSVLWKRQSQFPVDFRSVCLGDGNLYFCSLSVQGKGIAPELADKWGAKIEADCAAAALDLKSGEEKWRTNVPWVSGALLIYSNATAGFVDSKYMIWGCGVSTKALDAKSGKVVKEYPGAWSGGPNGGESSAPIFLDGKMYPGARPKYRCIDMATGNEEKNFCPTPGCSAGSATPTCLFSGGQGFSVFDLETKKRWVLNGIMRAPCIEGPYAANGLLYNMPGRCGCPYLIKTPVALAPAGLDWTPPDPAKDLGARTVAGPAAGAALSENAKDDGSHVAPKTPSGAKITAAVYGGGLGYTASQEGFVWGADQTTGEIKWKFICGGAVRSAPSYYRGRLMFGADDGEVYCLDAKSGQLAWRFRAAPEERYINIQGQIVSTWPVRTGVAVEDDIAYCGAGLFPYDGAYLYALDVKSGKPAWSKQIGDMDHQDGIPQSAVSVAGDKVVLAAVQGFGRKPQPVSFRKADGERIK